MRFLLDTNTCIAVMRHEATAIARMSAVVPMDCAISTITAYELFTGIAKCADPLREGAKVEKLLRTVHKLSFDLAAAGKAGEIRANLEARGLTIGPYDLLLAGHAVATALVLVTGNTREFSRVGGLRLENWGR